TEHSSPGQERRTFAVDTANPVVTTTDFVGQRGTATETNGMQFSNTLGAAPRWGMMAPLTAGRSLSTPSGLAWQSSRVQTVDLFNANDVLSVKTLTDRARANGLTTSATFDGISRPVTFTSPAGRVTT